MGDDSLFSILSTWIPFFVIAHLGISYHSSSYQQMASQVSANQESWATKPTICIRVDSWLRDNDYGSE